MAEEIPMTVSANTRHGDHETEADEDVDASAAPPNLDVMPWRETAVTFVTGICLPTLDVITDWLFVCQLLTYWYTFSYVSGDFMICSKSYFCSWKVTRPIPGHF